MTKRYFTEDHEWLSVENGIATVGITQHAQDQLGDLVFVELPNVGAHMTKGAVIAVVESVKAASDVYAPIEGEVTVVNDALTAEPALVNQDAEGNGWLWKMTIANESELSSLMDEAAYKAMVG